MKESKKTAVLPLPDSFDFLIRKTAIMSIGKSYKPKVSPTSVFGGQPWGLPGESFPHSDGEEMPVILQIRTDECPYVPPSLAGVKYLVIFERQIMDGTKGVHIREYDSLDNLVLLPQTKNEDTFKSHFIEWQCAEEIPDKYDPIWSDIRRKYVNSRSTYLEFHTKQKHFYKSLKSKGPWHSCKLGGYATYVQDEGGTDEAFVLQMVSLKKCNWWVGDAGVSHFLKKNGSWEVFAESL